MKNAHTLKRFFLACIFLSGAANAQVETTAEKKSIENQEIKPAVKSDKKVAKNSIAVYGGLPGYAIGYGRKLNDHFTARVNYASFNTNQNLENLEFSNRKVNAGIGYKYQAVDLFFDFLPAKKSSFKFVVGASYLSNMETSILLAAASGEKFGDIVLTKDQIGDVFIDAKWSGISPYIAMGFGRTVPKHRVGFGFEIGGHFLGKSDFTFDATKTLLPLVETEKETKDFEKFIDAITFLPTIQFHLAYKF